MLRKSIGIAQHFRAFTFQRALSSVNPTGVPFNRAENDLLYQQLLRNKQETVLEVSKIQGDCILGFNKPYNVQIVLDLIEQPPKSDEDPTRFYDNVKGVKTWLKSVVVPQLTTTEMLLEHREKNRAIGYKDSNVSFTNVSFSYNCLGYLVKDTPNEPSMSQFDPDSAFLVGSADRSFLLGDGSDIDKWDFGKSQNHILVNIAADTLDSLNQKKYLLANANAIGKILTVVNSTTSYRGTKGGSLYGHEHFGFLDGLSQPEVRGTYKKKNITKTEADDRQFIVRRTVVAESSDKRYMDFSKPGFRLMDTGHFLLGHLDDYPDIQDGQMSNPNPPGYRTLVQQYPDWCKDGCYTVYRKIYQDVPGFWKFMMDSAKAINAREKWNLSEEELKNLAGDIGAKVIGRWWDGTPLTFGKPISGLHYPPATEAAVPKGSKGLINGFQFDNPEAAWKELPDSSTSSTAKLVVPPGQQNYAEDSAGLKCPYGGHIRKVQPRDEFTDIGSDKQTMKHRIIRRGNNYFDGVHDTKQSMYDRVKDVFNPTKEEMSHKRGLALVMYQGVIEDQFEFVQRHWANSKTRPRAFLTPASDLVIGRTDDARMTIQELPGRTLSAPYELQMPKSEFFTTPVGMGYFLLPTVDTITDVLCADTFKNKDIFYSTPAGVKDFEYQQSYKLWDWSVRYQFWSAIWDGVNTTNKTGQIVLPNYLSQPSDLPGIAYRLPGVDALVKNYNNPSSKNYLQFRSTEDIHKMAAILNPKDPNSAIAEVTISWLAFPKRLLDLFASSTVNPYEYVEAAGWPSKDVTYRHYANCPKARQMDEYCEWFTHRNAEGKITRVDITCESPEYWNFLFNNEPQTCLKLYRQYVSPLVALTDLQDDQGNYNMYNKWNTVNGAMHLNCPPNSLFAEVYIAAEASTRWVKTGTKDTMAVTGGDLITSGKYGLPTRASDPTIGANVNSLIRQNLIVSISDPVGLYLQDLDTTGWMNSDKKPFTAEEIGKIVTYQRHGEGKNQNLRIKLEIPPEVGKYTLGDCFLGGVPIDWAGQIIETSATVALVGIGIDGTKFLEPNLDTTALVPPKLEWDGINVGPKYTFNPKLLGPTPPFSDDI